MAAERAAEPLDGDLTFDPLSILGGDHETGIRLHLPVRWEA